MRSPSSGLPLAALAASTFIAVAPAQAGGLTLYGELQGGGMIGKGTGGDLVNNDTDGFDESFYQNAGPLEYGFQLGARALFFDGHISHHQFKGFSDDPDKPRLATWTEIAAGMSFELAVGEQSAQNKKDVKGSFVELGWNLTFGVGTGAQIDPPLSNDEITDKGFTLGARVGYGKHLSSVFDIGVAAVASYGYFFKNEGNSDVTDLSTHYQSAQVEALLYLRANIRLF